MEDTRQHYATLKTTYLPVKRHCEPHHKNPHLENRQTKDLYHDNDVRENYFVSSSIRGPRNYQTPSLI